MNGNKNKPDAARKKQLLGEYKNRRPEMGVIALTCRQTGESFLGASKNTQADFNSLCFKLSAGASPTAACRSCGTNTAGKASIWRYWRR